MKPEVETSGLHNSASLTEAENAIKLLQQENKQLKEELSDLSSIYNVLMTESSHEKFDERRIQFLKSQLIQMERQVLILSECLASRADILIDVESGLSNISSIGRKYLESERGAVTVTRSDLEMLVATAESCKIKLSKNTEDSSFDKNMRPLIMFGKFIKYSKTKPITLYDVCSGSLEHINLKHVAKLESKLAVLYHNLTAAKESLRLMSVQDIESNVPINVKLASCSNAQSSAQIHQSCEQLQEVCTMLLQLSVLIPSAPWPPLGKSFLKEISKEDILESLPNFIKSKAEEGRHKIESLIKAFNYVVHMKHIEIKATKAELNYHREVYKSQLNYIDDMFQSIKTTYVQFEDRVNETVCQPLSEIMQQYNALESKAGALQLHQFLATFKKHAPQIQNTIDSLKTNQVEKNGTAALSSFADAFFVSLNKMHLDSNERRESTMLELEQVKKRNAELSAELQQLFKSESILNASKQKQDYQDIVKNCDTLNLSDACTADKNADENENSKVTIPSARERRRLSKVALESLVVSTEGHIPKLHEAATPHDSTILCSTKKISNISKDISCDINAAASHMEEQQHLPRKKKLGPVKTAKSELSPAQGQALSTKIPASTQKKKPLPANKVNYRLSSIPKTPPSRLNFRATPVKLESASTLTDGDQETTPNSRSITKQDNNDQRPDWTF